MFRCPPNRSTSGGRALNRRAAPGSFVLGELAVDRTTRRSPSPAARCGSPPSSTSSCMRSRSTPRGDDLRDAPAPGVGGRGGANPETVRNAICKRGNRSATTPGTPGTSSASAVSATACPNRKTGEGPLPPRPAVRIPQVPGVEARGRRDRAVHRLHAPPMRMARESHGIPGAPVREAVRSASSRNAARFGKGRKCTIVALERALPAGLRRASARRRALRRRRARSTPAA